MKKFIFACILGALTFGMHAQELTASGQEILSSNSPISIKAAIEMSQYQAPLAALHFRDAKKVKTWNVVWAALGGWDLGLEQLIFPTDIPLASLIWVLERACACLVFQVNGRQGL